MRALIAICLVLSVGCSNRVPEPTGLAPRAATGAADQVDPTFHIALRRETRLVGGALAMKAQRPKWVDSRTPEQLAQVSCLGADGAWHCPKVARAHTMKASLGGGPPSWTVPHWVTDPANVSLCASDSNSCSSATCSSAGIGPCLTHAQIITRLGTTSPWFSVAVDETQISDQGSPWTDIVQLTPNLVAQGSFNYIGTLLPQLSGTIGTFTAENKTAGTPARITMTGVTNWSTACGGATCVGLLVTDTTHPAVFELERDLGSGVAQITQPVLSEFPSPTGRPSYVTIASSDAITLARQTKVDMGNMFFSGFNAAASTNIFRVMLTGGTGPLGFLSTEIGNMELAESRVDSITYLSSLGNPLAVPFLVNDYIDGIFGTHHAVVWAGAIVAAFPALGGDDAAGPDGGVLIDTSTTPHLTSPLQIGDAFLRNGPDLDSSFGILGLGNYDVTTATLWGPASLDVHDGARLTCYGGCTANLLLTGALTMHGQTKAYPWIQSTGSYGAAVTITPASIDANNGLFDPRTGDAFLNHP